MVNLARTGFASHQNPRRKEFQNEQLKHSGESSTASVFESLQRPGKKDCIFCDKSHPSEKCYLAKKMTLTAKQKLLLEKGACFSCLKIAGHISKFCNVKNQLKCPKCNNLHFELMCPKLRKNNKPKSFVPKPENSLSSCRRSETVFLKTLCILIRCQSQEKIISAAIDSGSQSSYVSEKIMIQLKAFPLLTETVFHALFGGDETEPKSHKAFAIEVSSLNRVFSCGFEAFSEKKICGFIPKIENDELLNELKRKKIVFADFFQEETGINLLIGADVLGKLLTGNMA
ncbi:uncharacterized protein NPIL_414761 [Nephila pilipes]|uniref:Peptidase aspartic putative domain-containing protein n=1 Tax=Nephila pilipes TaxID=299642 RepID=A0A8X6M7M0_NEPPI|nr:uncharacterized protein NPIL_414761 [Nephila pilipes]